MIVSAGPTTASGVETGVATRPLAGEQESGDLHVVAPFSNGVLVAAIDGLGHGAEAAVAARTAAAVLHDNAGRDPIEIVRLCHAALRKTRGAVLSIASIEADRRMLTWLGVGNVEGMLCRAADAGLPHDSLVLRSGVVGYQLPPLRAATLPIYNNDLLVFVTDGVSSGFAHERHGALPPQEIAADLMARYGKDTDDALVVVARITGLGG